MKKTMKWSFPIFCVILLLNSCAVKKPVVTQNAPIEAFKYAYIMPTSGLMSTVGGTYGNSYGIYGSTMTKSVNPADVIAGILIKKGFVVLPVLRRDKANETLIVNYGESGRRNVWGGLIGYTIEVTIQFISAKTHEVICTCTAEGLGTTEADDIRKAIIRALDALFDEENK